MRRIFFSSIRLWIGILLIVLIGTLVLDQSKSWASIDQYTLLNCTNQIRTNQGISEVRSNNQLDKAAREKAEDMETYSYWAHQNPITGKMPWDFIDESGYYYTNAGENLAIGFTVGNHVCEAWKKSPTHFANLINPHFKEIGLATKEVDLDTEKGVLIVQLFGSKKEYITPEEKSYIQGSILGGDKDGISIIIMLIMSLTGIKFGYQFLRNLKE